MTKPNTIRRSSNRKLPMLYAKHNGRCHYCGVFTVMVRDVRAKLVRLTPKHVFYRDAGGNVLKHDFATVEHKIDLELGGTNDESNLVLACSLCNHRKNDAKQKKTVFVSGR